jgi:hypothetical protein
MDFATTASAAEPRREPPGMTQSGAGHPVSLPVLVCRVHRDRHERLARGLRLRLDARSPKDILAASNEATAFDFHDTGAPLGMAAGSFSSEASGAPSVPIGGVEIARTEKELARLPVVAPPAGRVQ